MSTRSLRFRIACEAARLLAVRRESDFFGAKRAAARAICGGWARSGDLPTDLEIREALQRLVPVETL
ncbi:MAG TPA: tRNA adenylyltransferase, partial [Planctomycetaceae bacterium]|nr:tRNA adenylyltransferase [Planctomycetaceae bacterium]